MHCNIANFFWYFVFFALAKGCIFAKILRKNTFYCQKSYLKLNLFWIEKWNKWKTFIFLFFFFVVRNVRKSIDETANLQKCNCKMECCKSVKNVAWSKWQTLWNKLICKSWIFYLLLHSEISVIFMKVTQ